MNPIEPQQQDGMPREVATAILTEPKASLSNRWRKVCMRAREKVFVSSSPIQRMPAQNDAGEIVKGYGYTEREPVETEEKTARRFKRASLAQLGKWCSRAIARRAVAQRAYLAVPVGDSPKFNALRELYAALASKLDIIRDCAEDEINERMRTAHSVEGIDANPVAQLTSERVSNNALFFDYVEQRAYRLAFWARLDEEQPIELPDKIPYHQRLKDEKYAREHPRRFETGAAETTNGPVTDGGRCSSPEQLDKPHE